jgi:hypothetical protein
VLKWVYTAAAHCHWKVTPGVSVAKAADQVAFWIPLGKPLPGTWNTNPSRKVWTVLLPATMDLGTSTCHLLFVLSQLVVAEVAVGENVITALGTSQNGNSVWGYGKGPEDPDTSSILR